MNKPQNTNLIRVLDKCRTSYSMVGQKFARNTHLMHKNCGTIMTDKMNKIDCMIFKAHKILISKDSRRQIMESVHIRHMGVDKCLKKNKGHYVLPQDV